MIVVSLAGRKSVASGDGGAIPQRGLRHNSVRPIAWLRLGESKLCLRRSGYSWAVRGRGVPTLSGTNSGPAGRPIGRARVRLVTWAQQQVSALEFHLLWPRPPPRELHSLMGLFDCHPVRAGQRRRRQQQPPSHHPTAVSLFGPARSTSPSNAIRGTKRAQHLIGGPSRWWPSGDIKNWSGRTWPASVVFGARRRRPLKGRSRV